MSDEPKSALEIAMERLRARDKEAGVEERAVSDEQKAAIAEVRQVYEAKLAEIEILHKSKLARLADYSELEALEEEYRRERDRLNAERDGKIERLRSGD